MFHNGIFKNYRDLINQGSGKKPPTKEQKPQFNPQDLSSYAGRIYSITLISKPLVGFVGNETTNYVSSFLPSFISNITSSGYIEMNYTSKGFAKVYAVDGSKDQVEVRGILIPQNPPTLGIQDPIYIRGAGYVNPTGNIYAYGAGNTSFQKFPINIARTKEVNLKKILKIKDQRSSLEVLAELAEAKERTSYFKIRDLVVLGIGARRNDCTTEIKLCKPSPEYKDIERQLDIEVPMRVKLGENELKLYKNTKKKDDLQIKDKSLRKSMRPS